MLRDWKSTCYRGECTFGRDGDTLTIAVGSRNGRGAWIASYFGELRPGMQFELCGAHEGGSIRVQWFSGCEWLFGEAVAPGQAFTVPEEADAFNVKLNQTGPGTAVFREITIRALHEAYLPLPAPDMAQKHHVTGWKWGSNIAVFVHEGEGSVMPPDYGNPYEVRGWQHGRRIDLEIGNMRFSDEEEE